MKKNSVSMKILWLSLAAIFVLACNAVAGATPTPVPTNTPPATATPLPTNTAIPTKTPRPDPTATPLPPTPSQLGESARSANFEVKVIKAEKRNRVYPGGKYYFTPAEGHMLVDIGVKVTNLTGSSLDVKWNDVYIMNEKKEWWYPAWGTFDDSTADKDPFTIGVSETEINPEIAISLKDSGYVRLFYHIPRAETYYFGFADSPLTELHFK